MTEQDYYQPPRRRRNLSDEDIEALRGALQEHCRLGSLTPEDVESVHKIRLFLDKEENMQALKRIAGFVTAIENKVIGAITWSFIFLIGGLFWMLYNHGYLVKK
jgi:hypothetical protein